MYWEATVADGHVSFAGYRIPLDPARRPRQSGDVILGIRPQDFQDVDFSDEGLPEIDVVASVLELLGSEVHVIFPVDSPPVRTEEMRSAHDPDDEAKLLADDTGSLFTAAIDPRTRARQGERVRLTVNPARFHFFDPETGTSLRPEPTLAGAAG